MKRSPMSRTGILSQSSFQRLAASEPKRRTRKCALQSCRKPFEPRSMTHKACCAECALLLAAAERERKDRKETRTRLAALKTRGDHLKLAQAAFNAFIRARDRDFPCVSCGRFHDGAYDAGHYRSVGAMPALRFHELNVHRQCVPCNQHKGGNIVEYRIGLIARIGAASVEWLEMDHPPAKHSIDEIKEIAARYRAKTKQILGKS